ncbi:MAG: indolepyruvate oxidoreductase subunit beta [Candidatus Aenigmarchaeota archaeon]|nr:indolepyruvate oxidoreductase subunit beta [Candidatus Aenigmarchaeota archaeon]
MKEFNIVIAGVGGQGVITLMRIIAEATLKQGYDVKTSELHGLAQRGGPISCHVRFGEKIYSPLVMQGEAHLIFALEPLEALRSCYYGSRENETVFLVNNYSIIPLSVPIIKEVYPSLTEIDETLKGFSAKVLSFNASEIVKREVGNIVLTNIFMLGYAVGNGLIPLKKDFVMEAIEESVPRKYLEVNKQIFELGCSLKITSKA